MNLDEAERIASGMTDKVPTLPADVTPEQLADAIMPGFSRTADEATAAAAATSAPHAGAGGNAGAGAAGAASDADNAGSDRAGESDAIAAVAAQAPTTACGRHKATTPTTAWASK